MSYEPNPKPSNVISGGLGVGATQANDKAKAHSTNLLLVSSTPVRLYSALFTNRSGGDLYYMLFDRIDAPANGATPDGIAFKVADGSPGYFDFPTGKIFRNGLVIVASTSTPTLTLAGNTSDFEATFA